MGRLTTTQHALASAGAAAVLLVLLAGILFQPAIAWRDRVEGRLSMLQLQHAKMTQAGAQIPQLTAALSALRQRPGDGESFLAGRSPSLAGAQLQRYLQGVIERNGAELRSARVVTTRQDSAAFGPVAIQAQVSLDMAALRGILHDLESGHPLLQLNSVLIRARDSAAARRAPAGAGGLDLQFTATGYLGG